MSIMPSKAEEFGLNALERHVQSWRDCDGIRLAVRKACACIEVLGCPGRIFFATHLFLVAWISLSAPANAETVSDVDLYDEYAEHVVKPCLIALYWQVRGDDGAGLRSKYTDDQVYDVIKIQFPDVVAELERQGANWKALAILRVQSDFEERKETYRRWLRKGCPYREILE